MNITDDKPSPLELANLADPDQPPNFSSVPRSRALAGPGMQRARHREEYPLLAERLGPAWRAMWRVLCQPGWHSQADLWDVVPEELGLKKITISNLLAQARRAGVVVCSMQPGAGIERGRQPANAFRALGAPSEGEVGI
jgi:hypothetical protein